jgi:hypothetical protein
MLHPSFIEYLLSGTVLALEMDAVMSVVVPALQDSRIREKGSVTN